MEAGQLTLIMGMKGLENTWCVLLRQSIELALKHIYFASHPVEYQWALSREDYRDLTFQSLLELVVVVAVRNVNRTHTAIETTRRNEIRICRHGVCSS